MKTTIEMAREAAGDDWKLFQEFMPEIHRLAALVRADERAKLAEQPAQKCSYPYCGCNSKAWCKVERNEALDKMAENARELGLDYEPAQRKPLTDEQIVAKALHLSGLGTSPDVIQFARAIEAAHGIKENT